MHACRSALIGIGLFTLSASSAWPQQNAPPQGPSERHDPATSGAGPTSGAPGLHPNDPPKGSSVTIDSSGVATVKPTQPPAQTALRLIAATRAPTPRLGSRARRPLLQTGRPLRVVAVDDEGVAMPISPPRGIASAR